MKKILAIICAIALICSLAAVVSADDDVTELYTGSDAYSGWMDWKIQINTTNWGGSVDPSDIAEGGYLSIYFTGSNFWSIHLALNDGTNWGQLDWHIEEAQRGAGTLTDNGDGSYVVDFTYDEIVAKYGTDLSALGALQIATNCDSASSVTVTKVTYTVPAASTEESTEATTEATEATTEATEGTTAATEATTAATEAATEETEVKYVEVVKETVLATDLPSASGWNQTEIMTTVWGGELDPSVIVKGGCLKLYVTATPGDLWQVTLALNGTKWVQLDWHVDEASRTYGTIVDNGDGTYVVTFTYDELVAAYGADDFATTLGAIYPVTNAASAANITKITYEHTELVPDTSNAKTGDSISVFVALLAVSAMGIAVIGKKKEF